MTTSTLNVYLIRAVHDWCSDNGLTPYIHVSVNESCKVPHNFVNPRDGTIVLNISWQATSVLVIGTQSITFQARFSGVLHPIDIPVSCVNHIYAAETHQGLTLNTEHTLALQASLPAKGLLAEKTEFDKQPTQPSEANQTANVSLPLLREITPSLPHGHSPKTNVKKGSTHHLIVLK